jgi:hypothetical protein
MLFCMKFIRAAALIPFLACSPPPPQAPTYPKSVEGTSNAVVVRGQYEPVALDQIDRVSIDNGKIVLHGPSTSVTVGPPPTADMSQSRRHWSLTTENELKDGQRALTFTHNMSIEDFTIELPVGSAELRYGSFADREEGEVMVLAWGAASKSFWGYLTIKGARGAPGAPGARGTQGAPGSSPPH